MKKMILGCCLLFATYIIVQSCGNNNSSGTNDMDSAKTANKENKPVQKDASDFAVKAADGGLMEVEVGKLARDKAMNPRIRNFGNMMVDDHTKANNQLKTIADSLKIALPDSLSSDDKKKIENLSKKKGKDFDKAYMDLMLKDHQDDIAEFRKASDNLSDSAIKDFATNTLPVLEKHLDSAQAIVAKK